MLGLTDQSVGYGVTANIAASHAKSESHAAARGSIPRIRKLFSFGDVAFQTSHHWCGSFGFLCRVASAVDFTVF
jgi:hypothetical protein